jgi:hypothetical protein
VPKSGKIPLPRELVPEHLQRHASSEHDVGGLVDRAHAAAAEHLLDAIALVHHHTDQRIGAQLAGAAWCSQRDETLAVEWAERRLRTKALTAHRALRMNGRESVRLGRDHARPGRKLNQGVV